MDTIIALYEEVKKYVQFRDSRDFSSMDVSREKIMKIIEMDSYPLAVLTGFVSGNCFKEASALRHFIDKWMLQKIATMK